jgi:hypothetical protein
LSLSPVPSSSSSDNLLADPTKRFQDLDADYYTTRIDKGRKIRNLVHQLRPTAKPSPSAP